jgi:hypothetical protein
MIPDEKKAGACATVLVLTGVDQLGYLIAGFQLGAEVFWWLRASIAAAFLFFGWHLLTRGSRFARFAAGLIVGPYRPLLHPLFGIPA